MANFPTFTENGVDIPPSYPLVEQLEDSTIRSKFDGGYVQTRARYTRIRKTWKISYLNLSNTNKNTLITFLNTINGGADSFTWVNPVDTLSYSVRFVVPPLCSHHLIDRWDVSFSLEQI